MNGKKYLDFVSGIGVFALGYNNKKLNDAIKAQVDKITEQQGITEEKLLESYSKEDLMLTTTVQKALDYLYDTNKDGITVTHVDPADVSSETVATE